MRFRLLRHASRILLPIKESGRDWTKAEMRRVPRTAGCMWNLIDQPRVLYDVAHARAHWKGPLVCGSVWVCPVCAAKICRRRSDEILRAVQWARTSNLRPMFVTLTIPHRAWDRLLDLRKALAQALRGLFSGRRAQARQKRFGIGGVIRAMEMTHGRNGWHLHVHALMFVSDFTNTPVFTEALTEAFRASLLEDWEAACRDAGLLDVKNLEVFRKFAVDVRAASTRTDLDDERREKEIIAISSYMASDGGDITDAGWGVEREMTDSAGKVGRRGGATPVQLLAISAGVLVGPRQIKGRDLDGGLRFGNPLYSADRAAALWLEYVTATKGARRHFWSRGLKAKVGLADKTDEELAVEAAEKAIEAARLDREAFVSIRQWEDGAGRGQVLTAAEAGWNMGGADGLCQAIAAWLGARGLAGRVWSGVANRPDLQ